MTKKTATASLVRKSVIGNTTRYEWSNGLIWSTSTTPAIEFETEYQLEFAIANGKAIKNVKFCALGKSDISLISPPDGLDVGFNFQLELEALKSIWNELERKMKSVECTPAQVAYRIFLKDWISFITALSTDDMEKAADFRYTTVGKEFNRIPCQQPNPQDIFDWFNPDWLRNKYVVKEGICEYMLRKACTYYGYTVPSRRGARRVTE